MAMVHVDKAKGQHKSAGFLKRNGSGKIPVLELDDATCIGRVRWHLPILRSGASRAEPVRTHAGGNGGIEMRNRHLEFELLGPIGVSWRNGTIVDTHVQV